ncbi:DNA adenine methylase [Flavobacterium sp. 22076]|uniref:DNA adenine methylase n=1 Tax=unclassified Flavobacterium TaxID=196869 RepID=UPI003F85F7FC
MLETQKKSFFYSPLRYPGGKNTLFPFVSNLIKENTYTNKIYAEPYAGGCGLALKLLFENVVKEIYLNDFDYFIYSFWKTILNETDIFCDWIQGLNINMENWFYFKKVLQYPDSYNQLEIAKATFFLNRCNVSGVIKGGVIGGKKQDGKYKIDARFNKIKLIEKIKLLATKRDVIHFSNLDALDFLHSLKNLQSVFTYLDPPYFKKGSELYLNFYKEKNHEELFNFLYSYKKDFILSYDNNDFIKNLYKNYSMYLFDISQSTSNKIGNEIIIFSDNLNFEHSIKYLRSPIEL